MTKEKVEQLRKEWKEAVRDYLIIRKDVCNKIQEGGYSAEEASSSIDYLTMYFNEAGNKRLKLEKAERQLVKENNK